MSINNIYLKLNNLKINFVYFCATSPQLSWSWPDHYKTEAGGSQYIDCMEPSTGERNLDSF